MAITTRDPSFSVVPDYYDRAVNWDADKAAAAASAKLGWKLSITASGIDAQGKRNLTFDFTDAFGRPIENAALEVTFFHHAHGDRSQHLVLQASNARAGRFTLHAPMPYTGFWEFHVKVTAAGQTFVSSQTQYLMNSAASVSLAAPARGGSRL